MEKYSYCKELIDIYKIEELDSKTLIYRIDGFMEACNMNLEKSICQKVISSSTKAYINNTTFDYNQTYSVNFAYIYDYENGKSFTVSGNYEDIDFCFINYYEKDKNKNRIIEIPFSLVIEKKINDTKYVIRMTSRINKQVEFSIMKNDEKLRFYANIIDFSKVLNIIKSFVNDPEILFNKYDEIMNKKRVIFTNGDLNKGFDDDKKFEKPYCGFVKKIKMISNNH